MALPKIRRILPAALLLTTSIALLYTFPSHAHLSSLSALARAAIPGGADADAAAAAPMLAVAPISRLVQDETHPGYQLDLAEPASGDHPEPAVDSWLASITIDRKLPQRTGTAKLPNPTVAAAEAEGTDDA